MTIGLTTHATPLTVQPVLNALSGSELRSEAIEAFSIGQDPHIDVRGVEHMDVAGLSALVWILHESLRQHRSATLIGPIPPAVNRLLGLSGFRHLFEVYDLR